MAYQQKYFFTFFGLNNLQYTVSIDEDTIDTLSPVEVVGGAGPFTVEYPETANKYSPVCASGATINLMSAYDRQFFELFTAEMQQYRVRLMIGAALMWQGILDTEIYREDFSSIDNYPISFTANDGLNVLERLLFVDGDGENITTITSCWSIIITIFLKLKLRFTNIYVASATTSSELTIGSSETILHKTFVNCRNFIDEEDKPMTCREVLEAILKIHHMKVKQMGGSLFFFDNNLILDNVTTFKGYDGEWFAYFGNNTVVTTLGDLSDIGFASNSQQLEAITAINKQKLTYSPYPVKELVNFENGEYDFSDVNDSVTYHDGDLYGYQDIYFTNSVQWLKQNSGYFVRRKGLDVSELNKDFSEYALFLYKYITDNSDYTSAKFSEVNFIYKKQLPYIIPSNAYLRIDMEAYINTKDFLNKEDELSDEIYKCIVGVNLTIGNKSIGWLTSEQLNYGWLDTPTSYNVFYITFQELIPYMGTGYTNNSVADRWVPLNKQYLYDSGGKVATKPFLIPLTSGFSGAELEFEIKNFFCIDRNIDQNIQGTVKDVRLKGIKLSICDIDGIELSDTDKEYTSYLNKSFKNEGSEIKTILGTNVTGNPLERGALMNWDGTQYGFISEHTRKAKTDIIENLLLRSVVSNYTVLSLKLSCTTNLLNNHIGFVTYSNYIDKKFMIAGMKNDYGESSSEITLHELNEDNLDIVKSF